MQIATRDWAIVRRGRGQFGESEIAALRDGAMACVIIDAFCPEADCRAIGDNVVQLGLGRTYSGDNLQASFTGLVATEFLDCRETYLTGVAQANVDRRRLLGGQPDPLDAVIRLLGHAWPAGARIATEGDGPYFAGVIRNLRSVPHHTDFGRRDLVGWAVARTRWQLSWNLYLTAPASGGELEIWQRHWREEDEQAYRYDRATKKGWHPDVVAGRPSVAVAPRVGRLVVFNPVYYHKVLDVTGTKPRLAMSSFVGGVDERRPLLLWS
jgi:hypothetical protein